MTRAAPDQINRRRFARRRLDRPGTILHDGHHIVCLVQDVSDGGARVTVPADWIAPPSFYLHIPSQRTVARVTLVWRSGQDIGVQLREPWTPPEDHAAPAIRALLV